jgi:hypothetical protein
MAGEGSLLLFTLPKEISDKIFALLTVEERFWFSRLISKQHMEESLSEISFCLVAHIDCEKDTVKYRLRFASKEAARPDVFDSTKFELNDLLESKLLNSITQIQLTFTYLDITNVPKKDYLNSALASILQILPFGIQYGLKILVPHVNFTELIVSDCSKNFIDLYPTQPYLTDLIVYGGDNAKLVNQKNEDRFFHFFLFGGTKKLFHLRLLNYRSFTTSPEFMEDFSFVWLYFSESIGTNADKFFKAIDKDFNLPNFIMFNIMKLLKTPTSDAPLGRFANICRITKGFRSELEQFDLGCMTEPFSKIYTVDQFELPRHGFLKGQLHYCLSCFRIWDTKLAPLNTISINLKNPIETLKFLRSINSQAPPITPPLAASELHFTSAEVHFDYRGSEESKSEEMKDVDYVIEILLLKFRKMKSLKVYGPKNLLDHIKGGTVKCYLDKFVNMLIFMDEDIAFMRS